MRRQRPSVATTAASPSLEVYNIIPIHDFLTEHPSLRYPEVRAAAAALRIVGDLPKPPFVDFTTRMDLMDWLGLLFGFQIDNVRNQRENLVLHLANCQMRLQPPPLHPDGLDPTVLRRFRKKLLRNYTNWCSFLGVRCHVTSPTQSRRQTNVVLNLRRELLYVALYLLIWGESANLRFMPECLCYIFHHMAMELNKVLDGEFDDMTGMPYWPSFSGDCAFLKSVVMPIYKTVKTEVESSNNGTKPHSAWRNYDDINEYFWSKRALKSLKWPLDYSSNFFDTTPKSSRVGKTGFVEQRSFWNVYRSFDRLWILLLLYLQAAIIVATSDVQFPWQDRDVEVALLTVFISWAGLRLLQSVLDASTQYSLVSKETVWLFIRLILKFVVAVAWTVLFSVFYARIWSQKNKDGRWSDAANDRIIVFLKLVFVYVMPELLALVLFIVPWVRNWIEELNLGVVYFLTWWFYSKTFVGRGMREGLVDNFKYTVFWIVVLASKFIFSYYLQIKPLIAPTRALLNLKNATYNWHEFFGSTHRIAVGMLWLPVILVYLMDLQIWYSIYSSLVGATIGLFSHLGEIRNIDQLRLRFQFFSSAMQFNLKPEEHLLSPKATMLKKARDAIHRLKLRYGIGQPFNKIESSQVEATWFALIWNEIILTFREEDLISDREVELLELPPNCWNIRVIRWPCFLLCNELLLALSQANELCDAPDRWLWSKICSSEYRRCAVIEAFDSIKYVILKIVKNGTEEESILNRLFMEIDENMENEKITDVYKLTVLLRIHEKLISLLERLMDPEKKVFRIVNLLQALYELCAWEFPRIRRSTPQLRQLGLAPISLDAGTELLFVNAINLPPLGDVVFYKQIRRVHTILTSRDPMHNVPKNLEARERLAFFSNSLFMNMPQAPSVEKMMAFSVLTPYYDEEVMYRQEMLRAENEDGISTLFYLQRIYEDEWVNFVERMRREGAENENDIWSKKVRDLRLWASYRGQTLSRTVRGMMYYYSALKKLAFLDSASEMDIRMGTQIAPEQPRSYYTNDGGDNTLQPTPSQEISRMASGITHLLKGSEYGSAMMKFTYVVACQVYGQHKARGDHRAEEILFLMKNHEALRIAYIDEVILGREVEYYSVLVKFDQQLQREVEVYRIRLPGPLKLGEGKPENQNHALIFTRGDAIQTIDMNQDNHFEEALKMRNLLESFKTTYGIRKPTILGVREKVFTGSVSSLAWFMSAQETSFVTLGQRVLANPLKVRMHYGHPDVFDRFWFLPRGGISKASRVINISEDIFAGFNCTLRGGNVTHHEYIQVGKGRDVGLNQISMFEAKVASGNGEQALSRDVYRLGHRLDFFRMLSFFYTTIGYYFNTMLIIFTVYAFLWGRLYLALSGVEKIAKDRSNSNEALAAILNQQFIIQLGLFTALPMILENSLERGFLPAIWDFITMQLQLASFFYTFSMGTRTHYFGRTILHGGAKYRATGRGFVVEHKKFSENYRLYARTHFIKAIELAIILLVYAAYSPLAKSSLVYILMTISSWFLITSWIISPFLFNPSGFDWLKTVYDFDDFIAWLWSRGGLFTKADQSWFTWWNEEQEHLKTTGVWGKLLEIILDLRFFFFQYSIVYHLRIAEKRTSIGVYLISWGCIIGIAAIYITTIYAQKKYSVKEHIKYRFIQFLVIVLTVLVVVLMLQFTKLTVVDLLISLLAFVPTGWGLISIAQVLKPFLLSTVVWDTVISVARLYDLFFGLIVMAPVALLSWLPGFQNMQTRILFNEAFSRGLQISIILAGKKNT
ncbi:PREDICTED: callose synthase 11-like isoform X2 [Camelina sativa]|uniref:1,3-beta-glucan synthase n=1 Tax=Camelina sativa TaxID=90675 RepID=A0ABM0VGJ4_CAMSA|nr:PREDICTED: callose synthase 11-like isoform X1 [Camelina sativa]XP_010455824.1 PREDICTED: callose synthase 11-like isoform X3 [Camelina sativa]XP_019090539.1 PREDICTED: callose synthase 11-like isoform X2 [Camelina sativa]